MGHSPTPRRTLYLGMDSFTYKAYDGIQNSSVATVSINVTDTAPAAYPENYDDSSNGTLTISAQNGVIVPDRDTATPS